MTPAAMPARNSGANAAFVPPGLPGGMAQNGGANRPARYSAMVVKVCLRAASDKALPSAAIPKSPRGLCAEVAPYMRVAQGRAAVPLAEARFDLLAQAGRVDDHVAEAAGGQRLERPLHQRLAVHL